jgi:hypothetical protein
MGISVFSWSLDFKLFSFSLYFTITSWEFTVVALKVVLNLVMMLFLFSYVALYPSFIKAREQIKILFFPWFWSSWKQLSCSSNGAFSSLSLYLINRPWSWLKIADLDLLSALLVGDNFFKIKGLVLIPQGPWAKFFAFFWSLRNLTRFAISLKCACNRLISLNQVVYLCVFWAISWGISRRIWRLLQLILLFHPIGKSFCVEIGLSLKNFGIRPEYVHKLDHLTIILNTVKVWIFMPKAMRRLYKWVYKNTYRLSRDLT